MQRAETLLRAIPAQHRCYWRTTMRGVNSSTGRKLDWLIAAINNHNSDKCLLWPFGKSKGYGVVRFNEKDVKAPRLAFYFANGRWPTPEARHTCDIRACFNPGHITEGTRQQNDKDKWDRRRGGWGEQIGTSKLTQQQVRTIRKEYATGNVSQQAIADKFGVVQSTIGVIVRRVRWKQIE